MQRVLVLRELRTPTLHSQAQRVRAVLHLPRVEAVRMPEQRHVELPFEESLPVHSERVHFEAMQRHLLLHLAPS
eukprot:CAMPEP_0182837958 /NCGR_PEP_ID=MMETSP0006_2-20121128/23031_1 /TAXON_ID=97485 /ORGANISM="Prymnesium parvum, Strain Texoma1" /LENGTH=73 /DNA_ID=CAMNT_0024966917 /DNA_START=318 /DNA_END=535 /DNA_ORIENTATION=-